MHSVAVVLFSMIAVGTLADEDGSAELRHVLAITESIGPRIEAFKAVITQSTVPVGTGQKEHAALNGALQRRGVMLACDTASIRQFLKAGVAIADSMKPNRIVVGADSEPVVERMRPPYESFDRSHSRLISLDVRSAELIQYAANAMLAARINFMTELAGFAERAARISRASVRHECRSAHRFRVFSALMRATAARASPKDVEALLRGDGRLRGRTATGGRSCQRAPETQAV